MYVQKRFRITRQARQGYFIVQEMNGSANILVNCGQVIKYALKDQYFYYFYSSSSDRFFKISVSDAEDVRGIQISSYKLEFNLYV